MVRKKCAIKIAKSLENLVFIFLETVLKLVINSKIPHFLIRELTLIKKLSTFSSVENVENSLSKKAEFLGFVHSSRVKPTCYQHFLC